MEASNVHAVARSLRHAMRHGTPRASAGIEPLDLGLAFEIAALGRELALAEGERLAGYKIGLTAAPVRASYNYDTPVHGYLLESTLAPSGGFIDTRQLSNPMAEAEIAFIIGSPLDDPDASIQDVITATESVAPALEIIDSRWSGGAASLPMLIADNTNASAAVVGKPVGLPADIADATSLLTVGEAKHPGSTDSVLGNPLESVAWLARHLASQGSGLKPGDIVLSGSMNVPVPLGVAAMAAAQITGLGTVHAAFR
ncbi:2-keto-4-pentenoate hydratase [Glutamicibacter protophormiae]|uniref:2-keto-4-pentenoate hydratase n=1 Tax=Glutamicibacter protophormiae TaxID=37930 RepID=UPI001959B72F|nr:fumarylacetoacetate hydrolase family protein [Glutamicibacter protophormiae]QRQ78084.1 fumarylacetoacetate hydrolase family protein [Glutamicibacter protophormiae]